uniref:IgGFc-binding protein N-terminal domain-containing protein n=1 Tax=Panagrolaimus sp. PS1159 TaxID=55785 RepID=A0AC35GRB4_9BILA
MRVVLVPPIAHNVNLTSDVLLVIIDTGFYHLKTVKIQNFEKKQAMVIYSNTGTRLQVFENENLFVSYDSRRCFGYFQPHICNISNSEFAVYIPDMIVPFPFLLIQSSNYVQKGCVFDQNIFITKEEASFPIVIIANSQDICITRLLIDFDIYKPGYYYISSYWTTSRTKNVQFFAGSDILYFEFK